MSKSLTETARAIMESANAETLKPKSKSADGGETLGSATKIADAPVTATPGSGSNVGQAAAGPVSKDKSKPTQGAKAPEPTQHLEEEEEVDGDEMEISEELAEFIDSLVAEGLSEEEIAKAIEENFEIVSEDTDTETEAEDTKELEEEVAEEPYKVDMSEHVNALFEGESLSEEFRTKALTIFEAAVNTKLQEEIKKIEEAFAETLSEEIESIEEKLSSEVEDYLNYVVEQWVSDNEVAIEAGLRTELTEDFISGMRNLFAEHYIDIPNDKISVVESLGSKVEELEAKLNEEIERNVNLTKTLHESMKSEVITQVVEGLTTTQAEKLRELAESVEFNNVDEFINKITTLRESYFPSTVRAQGQLDTIEAGTEGQTMIAEELNGPMAAYVRSLGRTLPK